MKRQPMKSQTRKLLSRLRLASAGDIVTYEELAELIDADTVDLQEGKPRSWLATARRRLLRDQGIVTVCEPNVGVRLLRPEEVLPQTARRLRKTRRAAARTIRDGVTVERRPEGVTEADWLAHQTRIQIADLIRSSATEGKVRKEVQRSANGEKRDIDIDTLKGV